MGDKNLIRTLGDYFKPSHEGDKNTIELPVGNNVNGARDFSKPVKAIYLPQDVPSTSDRRLIELENQVQCLMEAHLAPTQPTQVNKITISYEICSGPHDTQYCMENLEQALVECASSCTGEAGGDDDDVMFIEIVKKNGDSRKEEPKAGGLEVEYFDVFLTRSELAYHKYLMCSPIPLIFLRNSIIMEGCPSNLKIPSNIGHGHVEKAYIDHNSPLYIMTRMMYNWIMRRKLDPRENSDRRVSNFIGRMKGMHVFVGNFTYVTDFMIVEDISSIIDPRMSQVVLRKPFIKISNMTHDPPERVVRFTNRSDKIAYKMPHKIERYNSLSDLEKKRTKSVYFSNKEDKRRGVEYVMSKILGFYK
nr:retrotransposon Orf1 [Tanacetum cinerariifolium]